MKSDKTEYLKRLNKWNNSEKYRGEVYFLELLLNPQRKDIILDYGCGTGYCLSFLKKRSKARYVGYDINYFFTSKKPPSWFINDLKRNRSFNKIYFMHSFAHITDAENVLARLKHNLANDGYLVIITPNKDFDDYYKKLRDENYYEDETVQRHYNIAGLSGILEKNGYRMILSGQFGNFVGTFNERVFAVAMKK